MDKQNELVPFNSAEPLSEDILDQISKIATDPETQAILKRLNEIHQNCTRMLESIYQQSRLSGKLVVKQLNDLKLSVPQETQLENERKKLQNQLQQIFGTEVKLNTLESKDVKDSKTRKSKTRGARNKWIPM